PLDRLPDWMQTLLGFLPLTHASTAIRAASLGKPVQLTSILLLGATAVAMFIMAIYCVNRAKD
ncbi:MAG: ABC transporter, partial [Desulfobulbaceae bacterium]|nr:ABC transporter [Desulfobulbaceae bacterium]